MARALISPSRSGSADVCEHRLLAVGREGLDPRNASRVASKTAWVVP